MTRAVSPASRSASMRGPARSQETKSSRRLSMSSDRGRSFRSSRRESPIVCGHQHLPLRAEVPAEVGEAEHVNFVHKLQRIVHDHEWKTSPASAQAECDEVRERDNVELALAADNLRVVADLDKPVVHAREG